MSPSHKAKRLKLMSVPIHSAVKNGDIKWIKKIISADKNTTNKVKGLNENSEVNKVCAAGVTALHIAAEKGSKEIVELLLENGANIDSKNKKGSTALHIATAKSFESIVELLLNRGANLNIEDKNGKTPIRVAIDTGCLTLFELILKFGPNLANDNNRYALVAALLGAVGEKHRRSSKKNYRKMVEKLWEHGFTINSEHNMTRDLVIATVRAGNVQLVEEFLKYGASVNIATEEQAWSLLHVAVLENHVDMAKMLIDHGAEVNAEDKSGKKTPIFYAIDVDHKEMFHVLLEKGARVENNPSLLHVAALVRDLEIMDILFERDPEIDVNATDQRGWTALHFVSSLDGFFIKRPPKKRATEVSRSDDRETVALYLLGRGAYIDAQDQDGETPLHHAIKTCNDSIVDVLINFGADGDCPDNDGRTPFYISIFRAHDSTFMRLLEYGADVNTTTIDGLTPLHDAAISGEVHYVEYLIDFGADVDAGDKFGFTPLHFAAQEGYNDVVRVLLAKGANVNAKKKDGRCALHCASNRQFEHVMDIMMKLEWDDVMTAHRINSCRNDTRTRHRDGRIWNRNGKTSEFDKVIETLIENGARINERDKKGWTALHLASRDGNVPAVEALLKLGADVDIVCGGNLTPFHTASNGYRLLHEDTRLIRSILLKHMFKLAALTGFCGQKSFKRTYAIVHLQGNFFTDCENEVAAMKEETINETNIRYFDIVTKDENKLALYLTNWRITRAIQWGEYKEKFPLYSDIIANSIAKGEKRKKLLDSSVGQFSTLAKCHLPDFIVRDTLSCLTNDDLENLLVACSDK